MDRCHSIPFKCVKKLIGLNKNKASPGRWVQYGFFTAQGGVWPDGGQNIPTQENKFGL